MDLSFDIIEVAKRIKDTRIEKNITQMKLADEMGVSYQAVSNWERGNSMPDISKLRELCAILGISIDYLLGGNMGDTVKKAVDIMENKPTKMSAKELYEIVPLLLPDKVEDIAKNVAESNNEISIKLLCTLAPFISSNTLNDMANKLKFVNGDELVELAPFLNKKTLNELADKIESISAAALTNLFPFLSGQALEKLAAKLIKPE